MVRVLGSELCEAFTFDPDSYQFHLSNFLLQNLIWIKVFHFPVLVLLLCMQVIRKTRYMLTSLLFMPHQRSFMMKQNKECVVSVVKKKVISIADGAIQILLKQKIRSRPLKHLD